jgi:hypothetical protein
MCQGQLIQEFQGMKTVSTGPSPEKPSSQCLMAGFPSDSPSAKNKKQDSACWIFLRNGIHKMTSSLLFAKVIHTEQSVAGHVLRFAHSVYFVCRLRGLDEPKLPKPTVGRSLFGTESEALGATNRGLGIYRHYSGGIYRVLARQVLWVETEPGVSDPDALPRDQMVLYEHLFPNPHGLYCRPEQLFFEPGRFTLVPGNSDSHTHLST